MPRQSLIGGPDLAYFVVTPPEPGVTNMNILHIDSSIFGDNSATKHLSAQVIARLGAAYPGAHIITRDLGADPLPHLTGADVAARGTVADPVLAEFKAANIIVIGSPMYNFGISSQLKAWIDRIGVAGETFRYTAEGPAGLMQGKLVIVLTARGSDFSVPAFAAMDHQEPHLRTFFAFIGIDDATFIHAQGLALSPDARGPAIAKAEAQIAALDLPSIHRIAA